MARIAYTKGALTGGGTDDLDGIDGQYLNDKDFCIILSDTDGFTFFKLDAESGATADGINIIEPVLNAGDKRWLKQLYDNSNPDILVQTLTDADSVTVDWSLGSTAEITLDRATTAFTFTGAYNGQRCVLIIKQYAGTGAVTFGTEVRAGTDLTSPPTLSPVDGSKDYLGYIYNGSDTKYDFVSLIQGF